MKLRVGIMGAGKISNIHLETLSKNPDIGIISICDSVIEKAKKQAEKFNIPNIFGSWEELLAYDNIDAIDILLPNYLHSKVAIEALKRDKHVICEKPLAISIDEIAKIKEAEKESKAKVYLKQYLRYSPVHKYAKELINKKAIGTIYLAKANYSANINAFSNPENWRSSKKLAGGGVLIECGVHQIDYLIDIFGSPKSVSGIIKGKGVEFLSHSVMDYGNFIALVTCNAKQILNSNWWTKSFFGKNGQINIIDKKKETLKLEVLNNNGHSEIIEEKDWWAKANSAAINDIVKCIISGQEPLVSLDDAEKVIAVIIGTYHSSKENRSIKT